MIRVFCCLLLAPQLFAAYAARDLVLPVVGRATGADGRIFDTSIWITNVSPHAADVTLAFYQSAFSNIAPHKTTLHLAAGETHIIDSFEATGSGAMRVKSSADVIANARTFSRMPDEPESRTIGASFAAIPTQFAIGKGESTQLQGIAPRTSRYKIYIVETEGKALAINLALLDPHGAPLADKMLFLGAHQQTTADIADLFADLHADRAVLRVRGVNGDGRVVLAGSQIEADSKDSSPFEMSFATKPRKGISRIEFAAYIAIAVSVVIAALTKTRHAALGTRHSA